MTTTAEKISLACRIVGSQSAMAKRLGVSAPTVNQWVSGKRPVPIEYCWAIESATQGAVSRRDLRPSDFHLIWPDLSPVEA